MAKLSWKPWHDVVKLRDDLKSGELPMHMFAADLYEVMMQNGKRPIYEEPDPVFSTHLPDAQPANLVREVVLRLAGKNDKVVRQLELTYGGGKTHTLITICAISSTIRPTRSAGGERVHRGDRPDAAPKLRVAALCFDKLDVENGDGRGAAPTVRCGGSNNRGACWRIRSQATTVSN